jgi:hypothetical protein
MVHLVKVYRNAAGDVFFRLSPTTGRMGKLQVEAQSSGQLERWLTDNGFSLQFQGRSGMAPAAA